MRSEPDIEILVTNEDEDPRGSASSSEGEDDIFMTMEQPKPVGRKESLQKERQISVDPSSLTVRQASFTLVSPGSRSPPKLKFVSTSLPSSASSSPRSGSSSLLKKIWNNESPRLASRSISIDDSFDLKLEQKQEEEEEEEERFKCGKLCMFLPSRGKGKPVRASSTSSVSPLPQRPHHRPHHRPQANAISRTVSMERFDCNDQGESASSSLSQEPTNLFFDLPLELIRCSVSDMQSPVTAAFLFDKDDDDDDNEKPKGVLKKNTSSAGRGRTQQQQQQQTRHVRFSTSSPTTYPSSPNSCITPRLRKARADFTAYVEAQTT